MDTLRPIETGSYARLDVPSSLGRPPKLEWIAIRDLVVDTAYQRDITGQGRGNVRRIATSFCWSMFAPVVVAPAGGGKYAIVDGQHRVTAAALCGVEKVPCAIIEAERAEQAAAFQAINGNLTRLTSLHLHHAAVAAGDERARRVAAVCARAKVTILRYPKAHNIIGVGETMAPKVIGRAVEKFGDDVVALSLSMIVTTGGGNPGLLKGPVIYGTAEVLADHPEWCKSELALAQAFDVIDLESMLGEAAAEAARVKGSSTVEQFEGRLVAALDAHFKQRDRLRGRRA